MVEYLFRCDLAYLLLYSEPKDESFSIEKSSTADPNQQASSHHARQLGIRSDRIWEVFSRERMVQILSYSLSQYLCLGDEKQVQKSSVRENNARYLPILAILLCSGIL